MFRTTRMEKPCFVLLPPEEEAPNQSELRKALETGDDEVKIDALKKTISLMVAGEKLPQLLMPIIRFVLTSKNHTIKKLLLLYWENVDMVGPDGKAIPEMILVCNALRNDLSHPNEYIRGCTLRYVCKLKVPELLEPLIPTVKKNLEHRHSYVKRNAILALFSIFSKFPILCPDAPELVLDFIQKEEDETCKRNALIMLYQCEKQKAIEYLNSILEQVPNSRDVLQLVVVDIIRLDTRSGISEAQKGKYIRCVLALLKASSPSVQFEAANACIALSSSPIVVKAAVSTYVDLLVSQSDNNVKLVILDKLTELKKRNAKTIQELLMEILRNLATPTLDIKKRTLDFAMDLVHPSNIDEVVLLLKKEINKTHGDEIDKGPEYRRYLVKAIHSCALRFPDVASNVVHALMDNLGDKNAASALDVINFVAEVVQSYPEHRESIVHKLLDCFNDINCTSVLRVALWIIGEYSETVNDVDVAFTQLKKQLGGLTFTTEKTEEEEEEEKKPVQAEAPKIKTTTRVLADGTYATQSSYVPSSHAPAVATDNTSFIRKEILNGNFVVAAVTCSTLTKLVLRLRKLNVDKVVLNTVTAEILLICVSVLRLAEQRDQLKEPQAVESSCENVRLCVHILTSDDELISQTLLEEARAKHAESIAEYKESIAEEEEKKANIAYQVDDTLDIRLLYGNKSSSGMMDDASADELVKATGQQDTAADEEGALARVYQLTGFSDPLYSECYVNVHRFDIVLDVLVMNRTKDTLQNVSLELATLGDLKLCDRTNQSYTIAPRGRVWIRANLKVSSTETGIIYGNLVYDVAGSTVTDKHCVVLNNIRVDIIDYIKPEIVSDSQYRAMWYEFEWENKVPVNSKHSSVFEFLEDITKSTNMKCLTPKSQMEGDCGFLAANLYARSIFGEDALANLSVEQLENGEISGYVRIRSKTQGIALSLGDKIAQKSQ